MIFSKNWLLSLLGSISKDKKDIKSLNQEVVGGTLGLFQCNRIGLRAMSEAKAREISLHVKMTNVGCL